MHSLDEMRDGWVIARGGDDLRVGRDDGPYHLLLQLLARVHHPPEAPEDVSQQSSIGLFNAEPLLHAPRAEVCVGRQAQRRFVLSLRLEHALDKRYVVNLTRYPEPLALSLREWHLAFADGGEERVDIDGRARVLLHGVAATCGGNIRVSEGRQPSAEHFSANRLPTLVHRLRLQLMNEGRNVGYGPEGARAVHGHLRGREKVRDRERMQRRHVARAHV